MEFPQELLERLPQGCREGLLEILAQDPRPGYQNEPNRVYGMTFAGFEIGFTVAGTILTVCRVEENGVSIASAFAYLAGLLGERRKAGQYYCPAF